MDEKIVNPVEETVIPAEPVIKVPTAETAPTVEYKPKKGGLIMGIIALCCAVIGALCVIYEILVALGAWIPYLSMLLIPVSLVEGVIIWPAFILTLVFGIIGATLSGKEKKRARSLGASAPGSVGVGKALSIIAVIILVLCLITLLIKFIIGLLIGGGVLAVYFGSLLMLLGLSSY